MKIRNLSILKDTYLGDIDMNFVNSDGNIMNDIVIYGDNGSGKSLICKIISSCFHFSVMDFELIQSFRVSDNIHFANVDFYLESNIFPVSIRSGTVSPNSSIGSRVRKNTDVIENHLLYYSSSRMSTGSNYVLMSGYKELSPGGLSSIQSIMSDLETRKIKNCVIIIDDIELGLSDTNLENFVVFLKKWSSSNSNQLIVTTKNKKIINYFNQNNIFRLKSKINCVYEAKLIVQKNQNT